MTRETDQTPAPVRSPYAGWWVGIVCGVLIGLWALPPIRYTLGSQLQFALAADSAPWTRALDTRRSASEERRLDETALSDPDDYLLQVGHATILADPARISPDAARVVSRPGRDPLDLTLVRIAALAARFPNYPGADAHLARILMLQRIRIQRAEEGRQDAGKGRSSPPSNPAPVAQRDVRLMEWALKRGERIDPNNAFWPAMLAATYFAAERDRDALRELARIRLTSRWDAYIYEEVLGQWRLYSLAFGDHGAAQKVGPLSLIAFPHLREMRRMAELARGIAEREATAGRVTKAVRIRHDLTRLGQVMRETAPWAYEALYGTEIVLIASTDGGAAPAHGTISTPEQWRAAAGQYLALLKNSRRRGEIDWITQQVQASCDLRRVVDLARSDASFPGIPPGIPLLALFGSWMTGVYLIQQLITLLIATGAALLWSRFGPRMHRPAQRTGTAALVALTVGTGTALFFGAPYAWLAALFLIGAALLLLRLGRMIQEHIPFLQARFEEGEVRWSLGATLRILIAVMLPLLTAFYLLRPILGRLHPVALLLAGLVGGVQAPDARDAFRDALLCGALPLALTLLSGLWGLMQGMPPLSAAALGLRRVALPAVVCLVVAYLALIQDTLRLDTQASRALSEAARNDRQWVLTHATVSIDDN